jgi:hypothetical protein
MTKRKLTKSDKARKLLKQGYSVGEVATMVGMNYGHAWNVKRSMVPKTEEPKIGSAPMYVYGVSESELASNPNYRKQRSKPEPVSEEVPQEKAKETGVDALLTERGSRYGNFLDHARITQRLKAVAHQFAQQHDKTFDVDQAEALDMIFHKIGRILNGDPNYADSWIDIAGYAKLVADRLEGKVR